MRNMFNKIILSLFVWAMPILSFAQTASNESSCSDQLDTLADMFNFLSCLLYTNVVPLLITAAVVVFMWGVVQYILNADDSTKRSEGRSFIVWGLVALFVIVSVWGLVAVLQNTFGLTGSVLIPQLQSS
jgi:hypothetical protein